MLSEACQQPRHRQRRAVRAGGGTVSAGPHGERAPSLGANQWSGGSPGSR
jgi:hypothetical protein